MNRFAPIDELESTVYSTGQRPSNTALLGQRVPRLPHVLVGNPGFPGDNDSILAAERRRNNPVNHGFFPVDRFEQVPPEVMDPNSSVHYPKELPQKELPDWFMTELQQRLWMPVEDNTPVDYTALAKLSIICELGDAVDTLHMSKIEKAKLFMKLHTLYTETKDIGCIQALFSMQNDALRETVVKLFTGKSVGNSDEENMELDNSCPICREPYKMGSKLVKLVCNHEFHHNCIGLWLFTQNKSKCPMCQTAVEVSRKQPDAQKQSTSSADIDQPTVSPQEQSSSVDVEASTVASELTMESLQNIPSWMDRSVIASMTSPTVRSTEGVHSLNDMYPDATI